MKFLKDSRRDFLKIMGAFGTGVFAGLPSVGKSRPAQSPFELKLGPRGLNARYMGDHSAQKLEIVRCAFIGVGARGSGHLGQLAEIEGTEIVAISDLYEDLTKKAANHCQEKGAGTRHKDIALYFGGQDDWKKMLREVKPDAVFISTPWELHSPMAIEAMNQGSHAFVEVPLALTLDELWKIVDTSENTGQHCMMMENVNYGREELMYLNMCRQGVIGEMLHGEASYIHELRSQMDEVDRGTGSWRTRHYAKRNGNLYPTHGLGPVAQYMNLARGEDNFSRMVSFSSPAIGRNAYAASHYPPDHQWRKMDFIVGDINTSIIKTIKGRTIMVQWDETSPRPYTRHNLIQGTKGTLTGFPDRIALEGGVSGGPDNHHEWAQGEQLQGLYEKYDHPLYKRLGALALKMGGHGGMDFIMRYRIIECLRKGLPLDQNVYEGSFWSAVGPLSELSVAQDGAPQVFPDFTRGDWKKTKALEVVL